MTDRPLRGTICTGDDLSSPVRYEFFAPPDFWVDDAVIGMFVELAFPTRFTECGTITCDEAAAAFSAILDSVKRSQFMIGMIVPYATAAPPVGTLKCDGSSYLRVDYPALYAVLHSAFIDDADNFTLPDMSGKVPVGTGFYDGPTFAMGNTVGSSAHQLVVDEIPSHNHSMHDHFTLAFITPGDVPGNIPHVSPTATGNTGGDQPHNNIQPTMGLDFAIIAR